MGEKTRPQISKRQGLLGSCYSSRPPALGHIPLGTAVSSNWEEVKIVLKEELKGPKGSKRVGWQRQEAKTTADRSKVAEVEVDPVQKPPSQAQLWQRQYASKLVERGLSPETRKIRQRNLALSQFSVQSCRNNSTC